MLNVVELYDEKDKIIGLKISQESFSGAIYQLKIPILFEIGGEVKKMEVLMNEKEMDVILDFDWALANDGMQSLCAVIYSKVLLEKLCEAKKNEKIDYYNTLLIKYSPSYVSDNFDVDQEILDLINEYFEA